MIISKTFKKVKYLGHRKKVEHTKDVILSTFLQWSHVNDSPLLFLAMDFPFGSITQS